MPKENLTAKAILNILAADPKDGESKNRKCKIVGYTGGLINVGWGYPVGIALGGLTWAQSQNIPILALHDTRDLDAVCGQTDKIEVVDNQLVIEGQIMPVTKDAQSIRDLSASGFKFQASVGVCNISDTTFIDKDQTYQLNGNTVEGPCYIVLQATLKEISIVPLGADENTNTAITAATKTNKEDGQMPPDKKTNPEAIDASAQVAAERERVAAVIKACGTHADIAAKAVEEGWTAEKAELECLRAEKAAQDEAIKAAKVETEKAKLQASRPDAPHIGDIKGSIERTPDILTAAACAGASMPDSNLVAMFGAEGANKAHDLRVHTLSDIFAAAGFAYRPSDTESIRKALQAAWSTAVIPNVLSNAMHKFVLRGFGIVENVWQQIVEPVSVANFKAIKGVRLVMTGKLQSIAKGGELKHVSLSDDSTTLAAATKGSIVGITREDLINDDLAVLATIPTKFGQMAGRTLSGDVFDVVLNASVDDFGDKSSGALALATLAAMDEKASGLKDKDGNPLGLVMNKMLCGPSNKTAANELYKSINLVGGSAKSTAVNTLAGIYEPVITAYFGTSKRYVLFSGGIGLVRVAFLNGVQTPTVETANADFSQLGIQTRCYFDYGCAAGDLDAAVVSTGA